MQIKNIDEICIYTQYIYSICEELSFFTFYPVVILR